MNDEFNEELREAGWNVLHENPGLDRQDWIDILIELYPLEVIDALGTDPAEVVHQLSDWWEIEEYHDPVTGMCYSFSEWAEYFVNEKSIELYDMLEEALSSNKAF